jgi:hypothetical protein
VAENKMRYQNIASRYQIRATAAEPSLNHDARARLEKRGAATPTFRSDIARILSGEKTQYWSSEDYRGIKVSRCWRGQIIRGKGALRSADYFVDGMDAYRPVRTISVSAEIEDSMLWHLITFTQGALSQTIEEEEDQ